MNNCDISWWQEQWFLVSLPFIFTSIGWTLKTWIETRKPYSKDIETLNKILDVIKKPHPSILNSEEDCFYEIRKKPISDNISLKTRFLLTHIKSHFEKAGYTFFNKKMQKSWVRFQNELDAIVKYMYSEFVPEEDENGYLKRYNPKPNLREQVIEFKIFIDEYNLFISATRILYK